MRFEKTYKASRTCNDSISPNKHLTPDCKSYQDNTCYVVFEQQSHVLLLLLDLICINSRSVLVE